MALINFLLFNYSTNITFCLTNIGKSAGLDSLFEPGNIRCAPFVRDKPSY